MTFQFENLSTFFYMAGHGPYVWSAYGVSFAVLVWLVLRPFGLRRTLLKDLSREQKRQEKTSSSANQAAEDLSENSGLN